MEATEEPVEIRVERPSGRLLATLEGPSSAGLHLVPWRTRYAESDPEEEDDGEAPEEGLPGDEGEEDEEREAPPQEVAPGEVIVVLVVDGVEYRRRTRLEETPPMPVSQ